MYSRYLSGCSWKIRYCLISSLTSTLLLFSTILGISYMSQGNRINLRRRRKKWTGSFSRDHLWSKSGVRILASILSRLPNCWFLPKPISNHSERDKTLNFDLCTFIERRDPYFYGKNCCIFWLFMTHIKFTLQPALMEDVFSFCLTDQ